MTSERVERRMEQTRERIVRAALELFAQRGFENATVADISESADIGKGTFFTYFPSKDAVLAHLGRMLLARMAAGAVRSSPDATTSEDRLMSYFEPACRWHEANRDASKLVALVMARTVGWTDAEQPNVLAFGEALSGLVREGQRAGDFARGVDASTVAMVLAGTYMSAFLAWHARDAKGSLTDLVEAGIAIVLDGIRPRATRSKHTKPT